VPVVVPAVLVRASATAQNPRLIESSRNSFV
jgi:hypothetical protein